MRQSHLLLAIPNYYPARTKVIVLILKKIHIVEDFKKTLY